MIESASHRLRTLSGRLEWIGWTRAAFVFIWRAAPGWTTAWAALLVLQGVLPAAVVALTKWLVDSISAAVGAGISGEAAAAVLPPAALMGVILLFQRIAGGVSEWVSAGQSEHVGDYVKGLLHAKAASVDYAFYEASAYHDLLEQANTQAAGRILQLLSNAGVLGRSGITFLSIVVLLMTYGLWIPFVLLVGAIPALIVVLRHNRIYHEWWKGSTARRRMAQYYDLMLTFSQFAAEVRINQVGDKFRNDYADIRTELRTESLDLLRRQILGRLLAATSALVVTGGVMAWIALRAFRGQATLGDVAFFYGAFTQGQTLVGSLLQNVGAIYTNALFMDHLIRFLGLENKTLDPDTPTEFPARLQTGLRFENVTFRYPEQERVALDGFSLDVPAGKIVAIVGENGAGKSTFIKLLCRFYDPDEGRVTVDGTDLREFAQNDLRRRVSVLFQFPMQYQMSLQDNVGIGNINRDPSVPNLNEAMRGAGAEHLVEKLPDGYDTILGRWFATGTELSGGEWQRVALARAFFREAPVVILDEPTSFMDSWAENEWLGRFRRMVEGRTALIITHRFTTAMQADIIHVMEKGRVVESGSHDELVALGGRYATSWSAQMRQATGGSDDGTEISEPVSLN